MIAPDYIELAAHIKRWGMELGFAQVGIATTELGGDETVGLRSPDELTVGVPRVPRCCVHDLLIGCAARAAAPVSSLSDS